MIVSKKEIKTIFDNMPHLPKLMVNICPSNKNQEWIKELPVQIMGENQESIDDLF